jgi:glycosyltransferase involved in cell wall biosynthesis
MTPPASEPLQVSVVVPVRNEEGNVAPLVAEITAALSGRYAFEMIYVDDGSTDNTGKVLVDLAARSDNLTVVKHVESCGQSAAVRSGVRRARGMIVATLDGDGQNDPAFIPIMVAALEKADPKVGLIQGERRGRKDTGFKRFQSRVANGVRGWLLRDGTRDTGCGLKVFRRDVYLALPYFDALHRFMPALVRREGYEVLTHPVVDRPRLTGRSNYGFFDRLWVGILDLFGVWWLIRRRRRVPSIAEHM